MYNLYGYICKDLKTAELVYVLADVSNQFGLLYGNK